MFDPEKESSWTNVSDTLKMLMGSSARGSWCGGRTGLKAGFTTKPMGRGHGDRVGLFKTEGHAWGGEGWWWRLSQLAVLGFECAVGPKQRRAVLEWRDRKRGWTIHGWGTVKDMVYVWSVCVCVRVCTCMCVRWGKWSESRWFSKHSPRGSLKASL